MTLSNCAATANGKRGKNLDETNGEVTPAQTKSRSNLHLYLRDIKTGLTVECPLTSGEHIHFSTPLLRAEWDLRAATGLLATLIGEVEHKHPMEVLMASPEWQMVAVWDVGEDG